MKEAQEDIESGNLYDLEEVMIMSAKILEDVMPNLSEEDKFLAKRYIKEWKHKFEYQI